MNTTHTQTIAGIAYSEPEVCLLHSTPLVNAEIAARTAYDSFDLSEHEQVRDFNHYAVPDIPGSKLLHQLSHVYFHHSVLEHISFTFDISNTSRGVLQELSRHRIASYTVRSTRYTMSRIINLFLADMLHNYSNTHPSDWFLSEGLNLKLFVTSEPEYNFIQLTDIWQKLKYQWTRIGEDAFLDLSTTKSIRISYDEYSHNHDQFYSAAIQAKQKRNVGDNFKHIVNDNWSTDLVMTINLRSLKNFLELRDSGAAYFQMQWLAKTMKSYIDDRYLSLIERK